MIAPEVVNEIKRMLHEGALPQRRIAVEAGVSRGTVNAIARGRRPDYEAQRSRRQGQVVFPSGPPIRCRQCGAKVQMPCLACQIRSTQKRRRKTLSRSPQTDRPAVA